MKLYNGKDLKDALKELKVYKEPKEKKEKYSYYNIREYFERMEQVFGQDGYRSFYSDLSSIVLPTGQTMLTCKCRIEILADDGSVTYAAEGYGSFEISLAQSGDRFLHLGTVALDLNINAFKAACREMGIFACRDIKSMSSDAKADAAGRDRGKSHGNASSSAAASKSIATRRFLLSKPLIEMWKDREGKPAYRMIAQEVIDGQISSSECEILFYPNQYKNAVEKFNELIARSMDLTGTGFRITLGVTDVSQDKQNKDYAGSYVFKRFGEGA